MPPSGSVFDRRTSSIPTTNSKCSGPTCTRPAWLPPAFSRTYFFAPARDRAATALPAAPLGRSLSDGGRPSGEVILCSVLQVASPVARLRDECSSGASVCVWSADRSRRSRPLTLRTRQWSGTCGARPDRPVLKTHHGRTQPMTKHDEARRAFLLGAAVGAGAVAGATLVPDALAQTHDARTTGTGIGPAHSPAGGPGLGAFFNTEDAATVAAFTERLMPGAPGKPGARD